MDFTSFLHRLRKRYYAKVNFTVTFKMTCDTNLTVKRIPVAFNTIITYHEYHIMYIVTYPTNSRNLALNEFMKLESDMNFSMSISISTCYKDLQNMN